jgi:hypothetical protein
MNTSIILSIFFSKKERKEKKRCSTKNCSNNSTTPSLDATLKN